MLRLCRLRIFLLIILGTIVFYPFSGWINQVRSPTNAVSLTTEGVVASEALSEPSKISLSGIWQFTSDAASAASPLKLLPTENLPAKLQQQQWQEINVPANWFLQGQDLHGAAWYQRHFFVAPDLKDKVVKLVFEGVDYAADVWLNGRYLGFHEGYFQPFSFQVSDQLRLGKDNTLTVRVNSPQEDPGPDWSLNKRLIKGIFSHHDTRPGGAWSERGQEQNTGGIWAPVYLQVSEKVTIEAVKVTSHVKIDEDTAIAAVDVTIASPNDTPQLVKIQFHLEPENFSGESGEEIQVSRQLQPGDNHFTLYLNQSHPKLWQPWDQGDPNLYQLNLSVVQADHVLDHKKSVFGFRSITFDPEAQVWRLNGQRLFLRGTNYIASQWLSEMTPEKYQADVDLMKRANINAVRVHAHIEGQDFYDLCDRAGLLVWQDFPLQWGYTEKLEFVAETVRQGTDMINLLYNHPAIFAWSLHNEPPWDADWMQYKYKTYDPEQNKDLDDLLFAKLKGVDSTRYLHKASVVSEHPWWGWYSHTLEKYAEPTEEPLITEFGAQALPNLRSLKRLFTDAELWPDTDAEWEKWKYHNFQPHETFNIAQVSMGKTPEAFVENTQRYQSELIQFAAEAYRRQRYQPVAAIFQFMFVENWPSINWGIVDYWRNPKSGYEALQRAYQPVLPSIAADKIDWSPQEPINLALWVINDRWTDFLSANLRYTLKQGAETLESDSFTLDIAADSLAKVKAITYPSLTIGDYALEVDLLDQHSQPIAHNQYHFAVTSTSESQT